MREAIVQSALISANLAEEIGLGREKIILSAKVSQVQDLIAVYTMLAQRSNHALHLGLTEAGMGTKGIVASSAAMGILLQQGIGDTIRISLTRNRAATALAKCRSRRNFCRPWASVSLFLLLRRAQVADARRRPCSRNWRRPFRMIFVATCQSGVRNIPVWKRCRWR